MPRLLAATLFAALAQAAPAPPLPRYDVASVKPNRRLEQPANNWQLAPGRTDFHNSQVAQLIKRAWGDFSLIVESGPGWIVSDRFDVVVQYPADTSAATRDLMLQALLMDRFRLSAHLEMRQSPIYSLVLARSDRRLGPGLQAGVAECAQAGRANPPPTCGLGVSPGRGFIDFGYYDMQMLARILSSVPAVGRRVVDKTDLAGGFKINLTFMPTQADDSNAPSIFTALQEQLGLKLESATAPVQVLVIDHIEQPASD